MKVLVGRSPLPPYPQLTVETDTKEVLHGPNRELIVTTLQHGGPLYNPYAARGRGPVRITAINASATRFWRRLPGLLMGRFKADMNLQTGNLSGRYDRVALRGLESYALDGEMYDTDSTQPVVFSGALSLRFLQP